MRAGAGRPRTLALLVGVGGFLASPPLARHFATDGAIESIATRSTLWALCVAGCSGAIWLGLTRRTVDLRPLLACGAALAAAVGLAEALLALAGFEAKMRLTSTAPPVAEYWRCPEARLPCRFVAAEIEEPSLYNRRGFRDRDSFDPVAADDSRFRILVLGDSFTWGASARPLTGSYVDLLEARLGARALVWNSGLPGTGQADHLAIAEELVPLLRPSLIVLAFYLNDFRDNMYPPGRYLAFADGRWVDRYDSSLDSTILSAEDAYRRARPTARFGLPDLALSSRLGTLAARATRPVQAPRVPSADEVRRTRDLLVRLRALAADRESRLMVLLIPSREDTLSGPTPTYRTARELLRELGPPLIEPLSQLGPSDYDTRAPLDSHWTNRGHAIVAAHLGDAVEEEARVSMSEQGF